MNFIFHGARVGGLRERRQLELEMGRLGHLDHCPDSQSGKAEIEREKHLLKTVHLRYNYLFETLASILSFHASLPSKMILYLKKERFVD